MHVLTGLQAAVALAATPEAYAHWSAPREWPSPRHLGVNFPAACLHEPTPTQVAERRVADCIASLPSLFQPIAVQDRQVRLRAASASPGADVMPA